MPIVFKLAFHGRVCSPPPRGVFSIQFQNGILKFGRIELKFLGFFFHNSCWSIFVKDRLWFFFCGILWWYIALIFFSSFFLFMKGWWACILCLYYFNWNWILNMSYFILKIIFRKLNKSWTLFLTLYIYILWVKIMLWICIDFFLNRLW